MGITTLEQNIINKTTEELLKEYNLLLKEGGRDQEFQLIKKVLRKRGEEV